MVAQIRSSYGGKQKKAGSSWCINIHFRDLSLVTSNLPVRLYRLEVPCLTVRAGFYVTVTQARLTREEDALIEKMLR